MAPKKKGLRAEPPLSERRQYLHRQHKGRSEELQACRQRLEQVRADNRLVDSEAARLREGNLFSVTYRSRGAQRCANSAHRRDREGGVDLPQIYRQRAELTSIYRAREDGLRAQLVDVQARAAQLEQQEQKLQLGIVRAAAAAAGPDPGSAAGSAENGCGGQAATPLREAALERQARQQEAVGALRARIQGTSIRADRGPLRPELPPSHRAQALWNQPRQLPDRGERRTRGAWRACSEARLWPVWADTSDQMRAPSSRPCGCPTALPGSSAGLIAHHHRPQWTATKMKPPRESPNLPRGRLVRPEGGGEKSPLSLLNKGMTPSSTLRSGCGFFINALD
ncbi:coiled-coil domain-containing protein 166-like isoform X2 [Cervus elaphus]|uniref:coiled-coil domain-containing protein 166-like isoform X2 n=1 Tax=Cervus elaphus TaxID=9860 RepID=UPI001CC3287F|nr:coiled-coil domain-containing protein 166-like isoform X2 [Cervus elaphus]XP_043771594.1 coiled-coil domain-containing protein 166-like isoform X2 [Cervus elaphus]XP_043771604.1 coiled-coil domain-containing protein 166-like isoform X2 [Cervus elaphus]